jgi:hypothetical protein
MAATISAPAEAPKSDNKLYLMIAAAVAALAAAGTAAKFMFMPKVSMDCSIPDATSLLVSNPSLTPPEVTFNVTLPEFAASTPDNIAIVA